MKTGFQYDHNEKQIVSSASIIKLLIMAEAMNQIKNGYLSLQQRVTVNKEDKVEYSILTILETGNSYTLKDIIILMIVQSDNTATNILIDIVGMENINSFTKQIGLGNTILQRKMMDLKAKEEGRDNLTTSKDMAIFLELLYKGEIVDKEYSQLMIDIMKQQLYRDMVYLEIPDEIMVAHKTGELANIEHEVGIFFTQKSDYIFSMLTYDAVSNNYARKIVGNVAKIVYDYFKEEVLV
jgi:beta-lactamase class A